MWLADRLDLQLHTYQLKTLIKIVKVKRDEWQDKSATRSLARSLWAMMASGGLLFFFSFLFSAEANLNAATPKKTLIIKVSENAKRSSQQNN